MSERARVLGLLSEEREYLRARFGELGEEQRRFEEKCGEPITRESAERAFRNVMDTLRRSDNVALATKVGAALQRLQMEMDALERSNEQLERELATGAARPVTPEQVKAVCDSFYNTLDHYDCVLAEAAAWLDAHKNGGV